MPSQRPTFFANFFTALRAHSAIPSAQAKTSSTSAASQPSHTTSAAVQTPNNASTPRTIHSSAKPSGGATTTALGQLVSPRTHSTSPLSRPPGSPGFNSASTSAANHHKARRGSDSSSEGFRDVLGAEKWYIGGRTAAGDERYFKLGVVKRHRSVDRLSLDRLSL